MGVRETASDDSGATQSAAPTFASLYRDQRRSMVELAWLLTRDAAVAEDVAHDAFVRLLPVFDGVHEPVAYLRRCVVNGVYERSRRRRREDHRNSLVVAGEARSVEGPTGGVADVVGRLPIDQRVAVVLRYWGGLGHREIADAMGVRAGTVRSHLSRATARLRKELL